MTGRPQLTDALLRRALRERAAGTDLDLLGDVLRIVGSTPQRRLTAGWGFPGVSRFAPLAVAAMAIVVAIVIAIGLLVRLPNVGPSPLPVPSVPFPTDRATSEPTVRAAAWVATGDMTQARTNHSATRMLDGSVLVAGGTDGSKALASAELYDPVSGSWTATGNMIEARGYHTATLLSDGRVLVVGGWPGIVLRYRAELYDPRTGTWSATGELINPAGPGHTATLLANGNVLVVWRDGADLYDSGRGTWTATESLNAYRSDHAAVPLRDGTVLVVGGSDGGHETSLASAELYDPDSGTWTATDGMSEARAYIAATLLRDGTVLVAGGGVFNELGLQRLASAELYDPARGSWAATGPMEAPRALRASYTVLANGKVLVVGGTPAPAAELYDSLSGAWTATVAMEDARHSHTATLLSDGTVLLAGGFNFSDTDSTEVPLSSAVLYEPGTGS